VLDFEAGSSLDQLQAASVHYRIAVGPHAGRKALALYSVPPMEERTNSPWAQFSLRFRSPIPTTGSCDFQVPSEENTCRALR
jgi:hypothetical protein